MHNSDSSQSANNDGVNQTDLIDPNYTLLASFWANVTACWLNVMPGVSLFNPFSAGIDFRRQNIDVRFWRLKSIPALKELQIYNEPITYLAERAN